MNAEPRIGPSAGNALDFKQADFDAIAAYARKEFGLNLEPSKRALVQSRLARRLRDLNLRSLGEYRAILERGGADERERLVSALTTNVTQFYREVHHFDFLEREVLPELVRRARAGGRVRIWSAGCSSGQEPYSLAGSLLRLHPDIARHDIRILATDIDLAILEDAMAGTYPEVARRFPSSEHEGRVFAPEDRRGDVWPVRPVLKKLVTFRPLNLIGSWPITGRFDIIMCRNVAIYFDKPTQERLWSRFGQVLEAGGHLLIGHSERLHGPVVSQFESVGITTYRKASFTGTGRSKGDR